MSYYLLTVTDDNETGSTSVNIEGVHDKESSLPYVLHMFGKEAVEKWQGATDESRIATVAAVMDRVSLMAFMATFDPECDDKFRRAADDYNKAAALDGITDHGVEYVGF